MSGKSNFKKHKDMLSEMLVKKNASVIPQYYHKDFMLYCNGGTENYEQFLASNTEYYKSKKEYFIEYDDQAVVDYNDKLSFRMWITVSFPQEKPQKIEVLTIAQYKDDKIYRIYELSHPNWFALPEHWSKLP